jgi:hypothetical protein
MAIKQIKGENFITLADNEKIFYCHIHEAMDFFKNPPKDNFVLITHNSDGKVTDNPKRFNQGSSNDCDITKIVLPQNLIKWYTQNVDVTHEKIESIPIGLENSMWFTNIKKWEKIEQKSTEPKEYKNLLYICHNIRTNPTERTEPYQIFNNKSWVTLEHGINGNNFDNYLNKIHSHKFVLCPEGNGTDTHRTWETLYVGSIPVEKRNLNNIFYQDLPICFVNKWSDITEDFLDKEYERITNTKWNLEKLNFDYWKNKIKNNI